MKLVLVAVASLLFTNSASSEEISVSCAFSTMRIFASYVEAKESGASLVDSQLQLQQKIENARSRGNPHVANAEGWHQLLKAVYASSGEPEAIDRVVNDCIRTVTKLERKET